MKLLYLTEGDNSQLMAGFAQKFRESGIEFMFTSLERNIMQDYLDFQPDIILGHRKKPIISMEEFEKMPAYVIWWINDDRVPPDPWRLQWKPIIDLYLVCSQDSVNIMRKEGCNAEYLVMGYRKRAVSEEKRELNMVFLGQNSHRNWTLSEIREEYINRLRLDLGKDFHLFGVGWGEGIERTAQNINHRAKIGLSISHETWKHVYSNRILEIMGHGAMCLCYRTSQLEDIFKENEQIVFFNDYEQLLSKYEYYIGNDRERERIAKNGREFVENNFTWEHKAEPIINFIKKYYGTNNKS